MGDSLALFDKPSLDTDKLEKIIHVLMDQVERGIDFQGNAYSLFQTAIVLETRYASARGHWRPRCGSSKKPIGP
jgi:hypothetical protein